MPSRNHPERRHNGGGPFSAASHSLNSEQGSRGVEGRGVVEDGREVEEESLGCLGGWSSVELRHGDPSYLSSCHLDDLDVDNVNKTTGRLDPRERSGSFSWYFSQSCVSSLFSLKHASSIRSLSLLSLYVPNRCWRAGSFGRPANQSLHYSKHSTYPLAQKYQSRDCLYIRMSSS
jgi:hypothetical protein